MKVMRGLGEKDEKRMRKAASLPAIGGSRALSYE
jgi:hypothetical protein